MTNPATLPLFIMAAGIAWNVMCALVASRMSKGREFSTASSFWLRQAGWIGLAIANVLAIIALVRAVF